jgi:hypothetical protein
MSKNVFANGNEVSAKKDDNKSIAAMADVCLSPPSPPAGPIPIPYPNTAMASDTSDGSKTVKIGGDEVGLKNSSNYKKSNGDEAATKSLGMGVVSHNIQGPMKHAAWSMDVKFEGMNAIRHMDLTTHNHTNPDDLAVTADGASVVPTEDSPLCEQLDIKNKAEVAKVDKKKVEKKKKKSDNGGWALTTSKIENPHNPGASGFFNAVSSNDLKPAAGGDSYVQDHPTGPIADCSGLKNKKDRKASADGKKKAVKKGDPKKWTERGKDSEGRLLNPLMTAPNPKGIKITMKVYHEFNDADQPDSLPCWSCREAICGAENCGIEVTLCTKNNKAVKAKDMCEGGEPKPKGTDPDSKEKNDFWKSAGFGP